MPLLMTEDAVDCPIVWTPGAIVWMRPGAIIWVGPRLGDLIDAYYHD